MKIQNNPTSKDLPLDMYVNGKFHAIFTDVLVLDFIRQQFINAGYTVELRRNYDK